MGWKKAWAFALVVSFEPGHCIETPRGARSAPRLGGRDGPQKQLHPDKVSGIHLQGANPAWIGPFELLSEEELRWWKESMFGPDEKPPPAPSVPDGDNELSPTTTAAEEEGPKGRWRRVPRWNSDCLAALVERVSRAVGNASDEGGRALQTLAGRSVVLGREGGVWLRRRWRKKAVYFLVGVYGLRLAGRVVARVKANALSGGDIILDAEDQNLLNRGAVLDTEGQAIILRLRELGQPAATSAATDVATAPAAADPQRKQSKGATTQLSTYNSTDGDDGVSLAAGGMGDVGGGWGAVESGIRQAIGLRCAGRGGGLAGGRARYADELAEALRTLEEARDEADLETVGPQHASLAEQAVLLVQARLCDVSLRSLRDGLVRASSDLSDLSSYWKDQRSAHRRMGVVKSVVLGRVVHGKASGKRVAVEKDQENVSTAELLLEGYLKRLGGVQAHLQARPKPCLGSSSSAAEEGASVFSPVDVIALEAWVQEGMDLFLGSLEYVEAALKQNKTAPGEDGDTNNGIAAGHVSHSASPIKSETSLDVVGAIAPAGATSETAVKQGSGMPTANDAFERITVSGTSFASKPDDVFNAMQQLRAGGKCGGGHDSGSAPLPSGATTSPAPRGVVTSAVPAAAYGSGHRSLPAILLLRSKPKKTKAVAEEGGRGWGAAKSPGNKDVSPSSTAPSWGARRAAKKRDLEKVERKNTATKPTSSPKPGSGGKQEGGGPRWGKRATMRQPNSREKGAAAQAGKKQESRGGKGPEVSGGLWEWLRQGEESTAGKNARDNGSAAKRSAAPDAEIKGRKGAARESADALKATATKKERGGGRDSDSGSASKGGVGAGSVSSSLPPMAAALHEPPADRAGMDRTLRPGPEIGAKPKRATPSEPSLSADQDDDFFLFGPFVSRSTSSLSTPDVYARALQRDEEYARVRREQLIGRKHGGLLVSGEESVTAVDGSGLTISSAASPLSDDDVGSAAGNTTASSGVGLLSACTNRCAAACMTVAEGISHWTMALVTSPATLVRAVASVVVSGEESEAAGGGSDLPLSDDDVGSAAGNVTASSGQGLLAACTGRCVAACMSVAGGISHGTMALATSPVNLVRAVASVVVSGGESEAAGGGSDLPSADDDVGSAARNATASSGKGLLAACTGRCAAACVSVAGGVSHGTMALVTSPATLVRAVAASVTRSNDDLGTGGEEDAVGAGVTAMTTPRVGEKAAVGGGRNGISVSSGGSSPSRDGLGPAAGTVTGGMLAACVGRCVAVCGSVAGDISRGTVAVVKSPARLVRAVAGSVSLSKIDLDDGDEEVSPAAGAAAKATPTARAPGTAGDGHDTASASKGEDGHHDGAQPTGYSLDYLYRSVAGSVSSGYEKLAATVHTVSNATFATIDLDDDHKPAADEEVSEAKEVVRSFNISSMVTRPFEVVVVRPCSVLCELVAGGVSACYGGAGPPGGRAVAEVAAKLKRRGGHLCVLVGKGVSSGFVATTASVCLAGGAVVKGLEKSASVAGRTAGVALSAPGKLSRAFATGGGRAGRSAGRAGGSVSRAVVTGSGRAGRSTAAVLTASWLCTAATVCMLGDAAAQGAVVSTKTCLGCVELAGRVLFVLPAKTAVRVVDVALRPFSGGGRGREGKKKSTQAGDGGVTRPTAPATKSKAPVIKSTSPAIQSTAPVSQTTTKPASSGAMGSAPSVGSWAARAWAFPVSLLGRRSSPSSLIDPISLPDPSSSSGYDSGVGADLSLPSPSKAQKAEAALAQWVCSAPSTDVPQDSGRRSRSLVDGASRARKVALPSRSTSSGKRSRSAIAGPVAVGGVARAPCITRALRSLAAKEAAEAGAARPAHWRRLRRAARLAVVVPVAVRSARYARSNREELGRITTEAATGVSSFFSDQLWQPCEAIRKQVFFRERSELMDKDSLEDAETSLQNMLHDFVYDDKNNVPEDLREEAVAAMDMSVVSRELEEETKYSIRGTVNGRIPRMLFIQATFLKKELLHSMQAIDELFQANQVTLRLISVIPAALLLFAVAKVSGPFVHAASSRRLEPTTAVHRSMRASLREIERLLTSSRGFVGSHEPVGEEAEGFASRGLLQDEEMGKLALHMHELQTTLRQNASRFDSRARRRLEEDLTDLMARGRPTVSQQIAVVHRMQRSYPFLRAGGGGGET
ncbi:conserved unknown protein [Ectocarpus siliculosus]|uniref:Uncharacterized protein n=1 Tax=Ectocarpus siliculosus TaxID=2880 RepID=D7G625_ECTSI|nr:conserved unknown protein [Ectocarpus siliculosus]|eukprot:CBJ27434.1 conserved unknown protein [Ectocarpus siliculosus]